jgi:hypothetical protein
MINSATQGFRHLSLPESVHQVLRSRILNNDLPAGTA